MFDVNMKPPPPQPPVVLAQAVYDPNNNTLHMVFAPFVDNEALAALDVIKACANHAQAGQIEEKRKPQILVPRMTL